MLYKTSAQTAKCTLVVEHWLQVLIREALPISRPSFCLSPSLAHSDSLYLPERCGQQRVYLRYFKLSLASIGQPLVNSAPLD